MNRKIKFKIWDKKRNKMIYPQVICDGLAYKGWTDIEVGDYIEGEIQQFTGSLDKNGKEIYEGDIVEGLKEIGKIVFYDGAFGVNQIPLFNCNKKVKIIGNIFENPELLKV